MIKVNNLTEIHHHHHQNDDVFEPTAIMEHLPSDYNSFGASMFIVIVLLWYSISLVCMLGIQIRGRAETIEDFARRRAQFLIQNIEDQTEKREILEELTDREKRARLWKIYFDQPKTSDKNKDELRRAEYERIQRLEKQLAIINRNRQILNDFIVSPGPPPVERPAVIQVLTTVV